MFSSYHLDWERLGLPGATSFETTGSDSRTENPDKSKALRNHLFMRIVGSVPNEGTEVRSINLEVHRALESMPSPIEPAEQRFLTHYIYLNSLFGAALALHTYNAWSHFSADCIEKGSLVGEIVERFGILLDDGRSVMISPKILAKMDHVKTLFEQSEASTYDIRGYPANMMFALSSISNELGVRTYPLRYALVYLDDLASSNGTNIHLYPEIPGLLMLSERRGDR